MTATTIPAPRRISTFQYARAALATALGFERPHEGATADWQPLVELADQPAVSRATDIPTAVIPAVRRPVAAITAAPEPVVDELGSWRPDDHDLAPARIYNELIGAAA